MSVLDIRLDRINGTAIQWFTARTDEPRASIVANIIVNDELPAQRIREMETMATAAGAVVLGYERLQFERPDLATLVGDVSVDREAVDRAVERLLAAVGPTVDRERQRALRLEIDACERVRDAHYRGERPRLSDRLVRHLPAQFHGLLAVEKPGPQDLKPLNRHVERRYEDLFSLLLGPDLYSRTAPARLPEGELQATMYGPSWGPGLGLSD